MDSVFGDWYEDRGEFVSRKVDESRVWSRDHERVDASRAMRSGQWTDKGGERGRMWSRCRAGEREMSALPAKRS